MFTDELIELAGDFGRLLAPFCSSENIVFLTIPRCTLRRGHPSPLPNLRPSWEGYKYRDILTMSAVVCKGMIRLAR